MRIEFKPTRVRSYKEDDGRARIADIDTMSEPHEGFWVQLRSWSDGRGHPEMDALEGKRVRIIIEAEETNMETKGPGWSAAASHANQMQDVLALEQRSAPPIDRFGRWLFVGVIVALTSLAAGYAGFALAIYNQVLTVCVG